MTTSDMIAAGLRFLLVEDEALIALTTTDMLEGLGAAEVRVASTVADACAALDSAPFDLAVIDVKLGAENGLVVAEAARAAGVPHLFTTGYGSASLSEDRSAPVLAKPYTLADLAAAIKAARAPVR